MAFAVIGVVATELVIHFPTTGFFESEDDCPLCACQLSVGLSPSYLQSLWKCPTSPHL